MNHRIDYANPSHLVRAAYHESAHAVVGEFSSAHPRVEQVFIRLTDQGGGRCDFANSEARLAAEPDFVVALTQGIANALAGVVCEELAFGGLGEKLDFEDPKRDEAS